MSKIVNTTRGLVRPTRQPDDAADTARDLAVGEPVMAPIQGRTTRPLAPVTARQAPDERQDGAGSADDMIPSTGSSPLLSDLVVVRGAPVLGKSPVSSLAVANLIGALEQHGRKATVSHDAALDVLKRLRALIEQVTERRSWPRVPRVRRRVQRRRREG